METGKISSRSNSAKTANNHTIARPMDVVKCPAHSEEKRRSSAGPLLRRRYRLATGSLETLGGGSAFHTPLKSPGRSALVEHLCAGF